VAEEEIFFQGGEQFPLQVLLEDDLRSTPPQPPENGGSPFLREDQNKGCLRGERQDFLDECLRGLRLFEFPGDDDRKILLGERGYALVPVRVDDEMDARKGAIPDSAFDLLRIGREDQDSLLRHFICRKNSCVRFLLILPEADATIVSRSLDAVLVR